MGITQNTQKPGIQPENYKFLQGYIYRESGIVIDVDKQYLLESRLLPVARKLHLETVNDLCNLLRATASTIELRKQVVEAMTTHETFFFRELPQYDALKNEVLPKWIAQRKLSKQLSFWSAAASTGQEAYSLAMMLLEMGLRDWNISIIGTDLSEQVLERARMGRYLQIEVNRGLPVNYLVKYFTRHGLEWQLKDEVRKMVKFQKLDLREIGRSFPSSDVVFCRNVLIYFDHETKKQILQLLRSKVQPGGYLVLGGAETIINLATNLERVVFGSAALYRV